RCPDVDRPVDLATQLSRTRTTTRAITRARAPQKWQVQGSARHAIGRRTQQNTGRSILFGYLFEVVREPRPTNLPSDEHDSDIDANANAISCFDRHFCNG